MFFYIVIIVVSWEMIVRYEKKLIIQISVLFDRIIKDFYFQQKNEVFIFKMFVYLFLLIDGKSEYCNLLRMEVLKIMFYFGLINICFFF